MFYYHVLLDISSGGGGDIGTGGFCLWGFFPGGFCPGGGIMSEGDIVLEPLQQCLFFICLGSVIAFVPLGQLPREDLRRAPLPPRPLVTPGPRCSSCPLSPHTYVMHPASGQYPPPSLSGTDIRPSIWSAPSLSYIYI